MIETALNFDKIDFTKHKITIGPGTKLYRSVPPGAYPLKPTGREMRFVTEPPGFEPASYVPGVVAMGTGALCFSFSLGVSRLETKEKEIKDEYEITLNSDIEVHDLDSICEEQGVKKPYMSYLKEGDFTEFYGKRIKSLRYESKQDPQGYNVVIFHDWFPEFTSLVSLKKLN